MRPAGGPNVAGKGQERGEGGEGSQEERNAHEAHGGKQAHERHSKAMGVAWGHRNLHAWNCQVEDNGPQDLNGSLRERSTAAVQSVESLRYSVPRRDPPLSQHCRSGPKST
jgi:hypothetical protein